MKLPAGPRSPFPPFALAPASTSQYSEFASLLPSLGPSYTLLGMKLTPFLTGASLGTSACFCKASRFGIALGFSGPLLDAEEADNESSVSLIPSCGESRSRMFPICCSKLTWFWPVKLLLSLPRMLPSWSRRPPPAVASAFPGSDVRMDASPGAMPPVTLGSPCTPLPGSPALLFKLGILDWLSIRFNWGRMLEVSWLASCALARLRSAELSLPLLIEPSVTFPERDRVCCKRANRLASLDRLPPVPSGPSSASPTGPATLQCGWPQRA
mmetsp:Transcript_2076/g.5249  ORF Transcript_2076/g.5249 Transcript_2076/m.5249 type:complete len:269 (+) Transcript_2076:5177-5983(+)